MQTELCGFMAKITLLLAFSNCATSRRSHNDAESEKSWQVLNQCIDKEFIYCTPCLHKKVKA